MKAIMKDIAKLAGVSPGTVSNALNDRKGVGKDTKSKIIEIAEELGYFRNSKKSEDMVIRLILFKKSGYVLSDTQFFSALIEACENECRQRGYELLISQIIHGEHDKEDIFKMINKNKIDGILLLATEMDEADFLNFENIHIPIVVLDSYFETKDYNYVLMNNVGGSYGAVKNLIENGHTRIGFLGSCISTNNFKYRFRGFIKAIKDYKLCLRQEDKVFVEPTLDGAYRYMKSYLSLHKNNLPTAFFALDDVIALGAIKAMTEANIKIPQEVSIIGFDDTPFSSLSSPSMTTVKVYTDVMGKLAVRRLLQIIDKEDEIQLKIEINTKLKVRDSVRKI
ncbi:LacI family DNA-binding transcriptional regulator [Clostridium sp.]|uniref:LacI family DNA-binding transcriptional regulator n=1 Tax=Clostridium sp. TaxID=1506 RepID=UPI002628CC4B|nr:LacI family DNA-binding transcriptional regulator [uncultured Clostridium sp.]